MSHKQELSHLVAVNAFLIKDNKFLLLKRNDPPLIWGPPGGKLEVNEDPVTGLIREVKEETNLDIEVVMPVTTWFGEFNDKKIFAVDYLSYYVSGEIKLSAEHNSYRWLTLQELRKEQEKYFISESGFKLKDFEMAWKICSKIFPVKVK
jgi:ADP-ribose pyrophosphatase YjhB (NUDIX family)